MVRDLLHDSLGHLGVGDVEPERDRPRADLRGDRLGRRQVQVGHGDAGARRGQRACDRAADPGAGTGHQGAPPLERKDFRHAAVLAEAPALTGLRFSAARLAERRSGGTASLAPIGPPAPAEIALPDRSAAVPARPAPLHG